MSFPEIPADLSTLSDEQLSALLDEVVAWFAENRDEAELADLQRAAEAAESIRVEQTTRTEAAEAREASVADLAARIAPPEETEDEATETETPEATAEAEPEATEPEPEQIAAAAETPEPPAERPRTPALSEVARHRSRAQAPREAARPRAVITAAADIPNMPAGAELGGPREVAELMIRRHSHLGRGRADADDRVLVASVRVPEPSTDRYLSALDGPEANMVKIAEAMEPEALVAAGGLCAPTEGYYDLQVLAQASRPVRDSLVGFGADRGGIRFIPPPKLSDVTSGITRVTAAQDASNATKACVTINCPSPTEVTVAAISHCLQVGNFRGRTFPEQVEAWMALLLAQQARIADTALLDGISTCSTAVTAAQQYGTARQVIAQAVRAVAGFRNRNRMLPVSEGGPRLRWMGPSWLLDAMVADLVNGSGNETEFYAAARAQVLAAFDAVGVNPTFYLDSKTGGGQIFGAQSTGALLAFPTAAVWYLFAEGSFIFLDGGELNIGLVRDSTLNAANNFQMFGETFENVACVGVESLEVTATVCANGTYAPAGTALTPCPV